MERRIVFLCLLSFLMFAEGLSWIMADGLGPCLVKPEHSQQSSDHDNHQNCPTFFAGSLLVFERGMDILKRDDNDKAVVAGFTIVLAISTIGLWLATNKLWSAGERQLTLLAETSAAQSRDMQASIKVAADAAKAATRSAEVAENALVTADRAWMSINADIVDSLVFEKDRIHIGVGFNLTNVGRSPATHVEIRAELCPDIIEAKDRGRKAAEILRHSLFDFGVVLFPNEVDRRDWLEMEISTESFKRKIAEANTRAKESGDETDWSTAWPGIMACVTYRLAGSNKTRHTVILYEVRHFTKGHLGWDGSEGKVSLAELELVQTFMSGQVT